MASLAEARGPLRAVPSIPTSSPSARRATAPCRTRPRAPRMSSSCASCRKPTTWTAAGPALSARTAAAASPVLKFMSTITSGRRHWGAFPRLAPPAVDAMRAPPVPIELRLDELEEDFDVVRAAMAATATVRERLLDAIVSESR